MSDEQPNGAPGDYRVGYCRPLLLSRFPPDMSDDKWLPRIDVADAIYLASFRRLAGSLILDIANNPEYHPA
jgi:hypothetical protein